MTTVNVNVINIKPIIEVPIKISIVIYYHYIKNNIHYDVKLKKFKFNVYLLDKTEIFEIEDIPIVIYQIRTKIKKNGMDSIYYHDFKDNKDNIIKNINIEMSKVNKVISVKINDKYANDYAKICSII